MAPSVPSVDSWCLSVCFKHVSRSLRGQIQSAIMEILNRADEEDTEEVNGKGHVVFYKDHCIDHGMFFAPGEDPVTVEGWPLPLYDRDSAMSATTDEADVEDGAAINSQDGQRSVAPLSSNLCFNCGEADHSFMKCPKPKNEVAIEINRKLFIDQQPAKFHSRYHVEHENLSVFVGYRPGQLSVALQEALGIGPLQPPPYLQRMRRLGYPPGWTEPRRDDVDQSLNPIYIDPATVTFPGINGPLPVGANPTEWAMPTSVAPLQPLNVLPPPPPPQPYIAAAARILSQLNAEEIDMDLSEDP